MTEMTPAAQAFEARKRWLAALEDYERHGWIILAFPPEMAEMVRGFPATRQLGEELMAELARLRVVMRDATPVERDSHDGAGIRARTSEERRAYVTGFAAALNSVEQHGFTGARAFLRTIAEAEGMLDDAETSGSPD